MHLVVACASSSGLESYVYVQEHYIGLKSRNKKIPLHALPVSLFVFLYGVPGYARRCIISPPCTLSQRQGARKQTERQAGVSRLAV